MPEIFAPPGSVPSSGTGPAIAAAVISLLTADPELGTNGALGVLWIGDRYAQPPAGARDWQSFEKAKRPAIAVHVTRRGSSPVLTMSRVTVFEVAIATSVDAADNVDGRELSEKIKDRALSVIGAVRGSGVFISGAQIAMEPDSEQAGTPVLASKNANLFLCESTIDLGVLWSGVATEV